MKYPQFCPVATAFVACAILLSAAAHAAIPASERAVLDAIYRQTDGARWRVNTGWEGAAGTECSWAGISCDPNQAHVVGINFVLGTGTNINATGNNLSGTLPALTPLVSLQTFAAPSNHLIGTLPSLTGLSNLQYFLVYDNQLIGTIPDLTGLKNLIGFAVSANQLTGRIPSLNGLSQLQYVEVYNNQLTGNIPALTELFNLQSFYASNNQLTGPLPALTRLTNLQGFGVSNNRLTGTIPSLSGLSSLLYFEVDNNQLTGSVPSLSGLGKLQHIQIDGNGLTGTIPAPPSTSLTAGASGLCNNPLNHTANSIWDAATGTTPWYAGCVSVPSALDISVSDTAVATGVRSVLTVTVTGTAKSLQVSDNANPAATGSAIVADDQGNPICAISIVAGSGTCTAILPSGSTNLTAGYSGNANVGASSSSLTKTNPVTTPGNLNQHGWTGIWYNPATNGQGIVFEVYPNASGQGLLAGGWFTFDTTSGGDDKDRWYSISGPALSNSATSAMDIVSVSGGNFNAGPIMTTANGVNVVGHAILNFSDCTHSNLSYTFTDGSNRVGNFPMERLDSNVTCDPTNGNGNGTPAGKFLLSGAWYTPQTSGQGLILDFNPIQNGLFGAWYTFAPNGQSIGGGASQRWYSLQIVGGDFGTTPVGGIPLLATTGGTFDTGGGASTVQVGSASVVFQSCTSMTLSYAFTAGTNAGLSGNINLVRTGPTPTGCTL